ncbi:hypothetical protein [Mesoplasma photuris]|uniref:hypothetical protein n=1 Tax=Mesoplasma photuris TaxID=217731 RepID=UPI0004E1982F|nr:hypothetical protein [Mesoplasma photuris]
MDNYELISDYHDNKHYNSELMSLVKRQAKGCFEEWMVKNQWIDNYIPASLVNDDNEIVITMGIIKTNLYIKEKQVKAYQFGEILYRDGVPNESLKEILFKKVIDKYSNIADIIFTHSLEDRSVLLENGFKEFEEFIYFIPWNGEDSQVGSAVKKLDFDNFKDIEFLKTEIKYSTRHARLLSSNGDSEIKLYNVLRHYRRNVYYIPSLSTTVVFTISGNVFRLVAMFTKKDVDLMTLLKTIVPKEMKYIEFGFIPNLPSLYIKKMENYVTPSITQKNYLLINEITTKLTDIKISFPIIARQK